MVDVLNNKKLYGSFVLAYILSFTLIMVELVNSSCYSFDRLMIYILISLCAMLCMVMGVVTNAKTRVIVLCIVLGICAKGFMIYNIMPSLWAAGKLLFISLMYLGIGWYPAVRWINSKYGLTVRVVSSFAIGNMIFTVISTTCLALFGLSAGSTHVMLLTLALSVTGFLLIRKDQARPQEKLVFTAEDAQTAGAIILILIINAVFMNQQYPHGAPNGYYRFMQDVLRFDKFPPAVMYGGFEQNAHYAVLSVPPLLAQVFQVELSWATYFELVVGLSALLISVYIFSRLVISDKHSTALFSMIFVALLGELHLYRMIIYLLFDGKGISDLLYNPGCVRSRTAPMFQPWGLACYIDNGKSWATMLFAYYVILAGIKDKLALFIAGLAVMVIVGGGQEEVLYGFALAGIFILILNYRHYYQYRWNYSFFVLGCLSGMIVWIYLTAHAGSLQILSNHSAIFIRPISDWGLYIYHSPGIPLLDLPLANYVILFSRKAMMYLLSEWSMLAIFCFFAMRAMKNAGFERVRLAILMALTLTAMLPFFVGTSLIPWTWNLNRFIQPLLFWLYLWAGVGFVFMVMKLKKISNLMLMAGTIILLLAFYPTIHFANTQLILAISRVQPSAFVMPIYDSHIIE